MGIDSLLTLFRSMNYRGLDLAVTLLGRSHANPPYPPRFLQSYVGGRESTGEVFRALGETYLRYFRDMCDLRPDWHVLDVGCGVGRMAIPLTQYLNNKGRYVGFDVVRAGVRWCARNITPLYPNFHFHDADIQNSMYNPFGRLDPTHYRFPFPDGQFDFVMMISVATHMLREELEHYLGEASRVLRVGGQCFITFYLLNAESIAAINEGRSAVPFPFERGEYRVRTERIPTAVVAYDEQYLRRMFDRSGLAIHEPVYYGTWSGRPQGQMGQDICILRRV